MIDRRQADKRRRDRDRLAAAADHARRAARSQQAESQVGRAPIVPVERYTFIGLLDELARAAGNGQLPAGLRTSALDLADKILAEGHNHP